MKFSLVLTVLYLKMKMALKNNELFGRRSRLRTGSVLIKTADNRHGRLFVISKGALFSKRDVHADADVIMIWRDVDTALKNMLSDDPVAIPRAMERGEVQVEGDVSVAQWFGSLTKALKGSQLPDVQKEAIPRVAMIGLGKMGAGIARNIQNSGIELVVYNRSLEKTKPFVDRGAILAKTPAEAASLAPIVITSLMDDASVYDLVTSQEGILAGMKQGGIHLCTTTISPNMARELTALHQKQGTAFVTGAVVGRPDAAEAGELLSLLAGEVQSVEKCRTICSTYSNASLVIGEDPCMANYAKLSANYFAVANMELMGQLYAYGDATGIGRKFYAQIFEGSYANPILKMYSRKILDREFETDVGFALSGGRKDVGLMLEASNATSGSLNYAPIILDKMDKALELGLAQNDWSVFTDMTLSHNSGK